MFRQSFAFLELIAEIYPRTAGEIEGKSCESNQNLLEATEKLTGAPKAGETSEMSEMISIPQAILLYFETPKN